MSRFKRLNPPWWLEHEKVPANAKGLQPINPVFGKDGLYLDRATRRVWLEYQGKAWRYMYGKHAVEFFQRELALLTAPWYTEKEVAAFQTVWRYLPEKVRQPVKTHLFRLEIRGVEREAGKA